MEQSVRQMALCASRLIQTAVWSGEESRSKLLHTSSAKLTL